MTSINENLIDDPTATNQLDVPDGNINPFLTYGCLIYLTFSEDNRTEYYAYSEGLTKTKVLLKTKDSFYKEGSYMRGLFRIYPSFYHAEYGNAKKRLQQIIDGETATPLEKRETRAQIPKMIKGVSEELALNFDIYEKLKGTPVRYGQVIQLLHVGSQKYLTYDPESPSDLESDCLKIDLTYENSERTCFRILPTFKYQQESQGYIFNDDIVYMMSTVDSGTKLFGDPYLHASRTIGSLSKDTPNKESLEKKEINVSSDKRTPWRVKIFSDYISDKVGVLSVGDIIWINLSEEDKNLIVHSSNDKDSSHSFKFILCSSKDRYRKFVGNSNGMFIVENLNMIQGGLVKWKTSYRLKHLATNKYLSIGSQPGWDIDERKDKAIYSFKLVNSDKEAANFSFEIIYSTINSRNKSFFMKYVPKDAYFKLRVESDLWVTYRDVPRDYLESKEQYEEDLITLPLIGKAKENNIFHSSRATQNEIIITMFLISCKNTIRNTLKYLDPDFMNYAGSDNQQLQLKHKIVTYKLERMKTCLKQLELFCNNKLLDYLTSDQIYGQVNPFLQNLLREQFFIELLAQTLIVCFPQFQYLEELKTTETSRKQRKDRNRSENSLSNSPTPSPGNKPQRASDFSGMAAIIVKKVGPGTSDITLEDINHKKKRICELSYKLINAICHNNLINKNYAFKYLPLFQMQADYIQYSVDCVNMILRDNEELLLNLHKSSVLQATHSIGSLNLNNNSVVAADSPASAFSKKNNKGGERRDSAAVRGTRSPPKDSPAGMRMNGRTGSAAAIQPVPIVTEDSYVSAFKNFYNKIAKNFKGEDLIRVLKDWEAIKFFAALLMRTEDIDKQKKLIFFFKTISLQGSEGININQEIIHKYFTTTDSTGAKISTENFLRIFTNEGQLYVKVPFDPFKGKIFALKEFLDAHDGRVMINPNLSFELFDEGSSYFEDEKNFMDHSTSPNQEILTKHIDLIAALCQSRNYSWKNILDKEINWEALLAYIKQELPADVRASLTRLLTSLYLDQEPRREAAIPLFCKIVDRKKLAQAESRRDGQELMTMATLKMTETTEKPNELNLDKFKAQLLEEIAELKKVMEGLPTELKHDHDVLNPEKNVDKWDKAYNSYIYEMLQITHLMLKFDKIKIRARKINMNPLPKETADSAKLAKKARSKAKKPTKGMFNNLNIFASKKKEFIAGEFEDIMRSLILLLEYDRTYPEAGKMLMDMRTNKQNQKEENQKLFSKKNLFDRVQGMANATKNLIVDTKVSEKRSRKYATDYDYMDKDLATTELYLKQGDVMKRILENLLGQQDLDVETTIKIKIVDILEYFFDYKQDKLFSNIRRVFFHIMNEANLVSAYHECRGNKRIIQVKFQNLLGHYMKYILPRILLTGTPLDNADDIFKQDNGDDILDINESLDFELLPVLLQQLCLNSNAAFERKILHLMTRMYNQRTEFSESVEDLLLLFEEVNIKNYNKSRKMSKILQKYTEESESWLTSANVNFDKLKTTKEALLFFYNTVFCDDVEADEDLEIEFDPNKIDYKVPNKTRQEMLRHLKIYVPVVSLIKDNIHIVDTVKKPEILELFRYCFAFLTAFVRHNEENQMILSNSLVVFLYHMPSDLGHVRLLVELFRDNETLCSNRANEVTDDFHRLILTNGRKADYLEFYKVIQKVKGEMVYKNQRDVLDLFLAPQYYDTLLYIDKTAGNPRKNLGHGTLIMPDRDDKKSFMNTFNFEKRIFSSTNGTSDEPFLYHAKLLDVLAMTACGKEGLIYNEIRLRATISFNYLLQLLNTIDNFTFGGSLLDHDVDEEGPRLAGILKVPVAEYIFYVYVESEKNSVELIKGGVSMVDIIIKERERIKSMTDYKDIYLTYLFDNLLLIFYWYTKQARENQTEDRSAETKRTYTELLHFADILLANLKKFDAKKVTQKGKENLHNLLVYVQKDRPLGDFDLIQEVERTSKTKLTIKQQEKKDLTEEEIWKFMWQEFVEVFLNSKLLTEEIDKEKKIFAKSLTQVDHMFKKNNFIKDIVNNEEICRKLINFIIENENTDETRDTVILILDALGNMIENETEEEKMVEKQNFLNRLNAVYMIFSKLSDPNLLSSDDTFKQLISFAIKLLEGGNEDVQKSVFKLFTSFSNSEVFFLKLHDRFQLETQKVKNIQENPNEKISEDEVEEMKDILRLLQLFAEGHFSDLQNYIRQQTNSYHSYDLLDDISDLLNAYMQLKHTAFFDTMIQCFDTITEFIQGPCFENQVAIIQGSFLDLACNILATDELAEERVRQKRGHGYIIDETKLKKWQLARLKYKCSITLMSLLEARKDYSNVYRMMKSIPMDALRMNITDIFNDFKRQYKGEYSSKVFLHFNFDPDEEHSEAYCSLIIETGFNLYFLFNIFTEAQSLEDKKKDTDVLQMEGQIEQKSKNFIVQWAKLLFQIFLWLVSSVTSIFKHRPKPTYNQNEVMLTQGRSDGLPNSPREQVNVIAVLLAQEREESWKDASGFFKKNSANIEVLREDNHLEKTYFYLPPFCHAITKDTKNQFNNAVNRVSAETKCLHLMKEAGDVIDVIKYEYQLQRLYDRVTILALLTKNIMLWRDTAFLLAVAINFLVLTTYYQTGSDNPQDAYESDFSGLVLGLGSVLIVFALFIVAYFMIKTAPLLVRQAWEGTTRAKLTLTTIIINCIKSVFYLLSDFYVLYYSVYGLTAIIGLTVTPFFFAFHMFDVLVRFPLLQSVLQSIWIPRKPLLLTFLLYLLLNYVFSLAGYYFFYDEYNGYCSSTWLCFLTAIDKAFKVDGGIGGFLTPNVETSVSRFVFDNLYNLLVMIIMINIVAGMIIDNFGSLREEEKEFRFDVSNICFICGHDRETLEKANDARGGVGGMGFINHIKKEHYLWNYLFYIAYIQDKEKTEYTGLESYIADQIENGEISWFPTHRALIVNDSMGEEEGGGLEPLKKVDEEQRALVKDANQLSKNLHNLEDMIKKYELKKVSSATKHPTMRTISAGNLSDRNNSGTRLLKPESHSGRAMSSERRRSDQRQSDQESEESLNGEKSQEGGQDDLNLM